MTAEVVARVLKGSVDLHVHPAPSPLPRRVDAVEAAQAAEAIGMRAIVVKSHHHSTVTDVLALGRDLDGLPVKVFGGIALNSAVGGLNPHAVDLALKLGGRIVWFPTIGSPQHIAHHAAHPDLKFPKLAVHVREERPVDVLDEHGELRPEVHDIIGLVKEHDAILASGHMAPDRILAVFEAAHAAGVSKLLVNHPNFVVEATHEQGRRFVELGAVIEHSLCMYDDRSSFYNWDIDVLLGWINAVGADRSTLGSDLGQMKNPLPSEAFTKIVGQLLDAGLAEADLEAMVRRNPARLLDMGD
ncbi:MAG TPA: DUF6282 family protein [Gaiellales bacterium]|nr:DUF6282 family protein [Gaiellales bacterium]